MSGTLAKIAEIEAEMARTQKNKATAHHLGLLKARLAKLRRELITPKGGGGGGPGEGFDAAKTGDARIGFVGFPSVGKSTLLSNLAGVYSEVAAGNMDEAYRYVAIIVVIAFLSVILMNRATLRESRKRGQFR